MDLLRGLIAGRTLFRLPRKLSSTVWPSRLTRKRFYPRERTYEMYWKVLKVLWGLRLGAPHLRANRVWNAVSRPPRLPAPVCRERLNFETYLELRTSNGQQRKVDQKSVTKVLSLSFASNSLYRMFTHSHFLDFSNTSALFAKPVVTEIHNSKGWCFFNVTSTATQLQLRSNLFEKLFASERKLISTAHGLPAVW